MIYEGNFENFRPYTKEENFNKIVTLHTMKEFVDHIKQYGELPAIGKLDNTTATFIDFLRDASRVGETLKKMGIEKGNHVGLLCANDYNFAVASIGIMAYGAVAVMLPMQLDDQTIFGCSMKYSLKGFLYEEKFEEKMGFLKGHNPIPTSIVETVYNNISEDNFVNEAILPTDPACILMTGGTTGKSKGVILSYEALLYGTRNGCYGLDDFFNHRYYCMMPLTHVFGFIRNLMCSLYTGSCIYFNQDKRLMFEEFKKFKPTQLVIVPALAELFLNLTKAYGKEMLGGCINTIICGAANVSPYLVSEWNKLGVNFCPGYGLTEFANMVSGNPRGPEFPEAVGYLFPDQQAQIVDGELWLKGKNMMISYYNEPEENAKAFEDGWFKTGDLARVDDNGLLYIIGRTKEVIVLQNGENISPAAIEAKFYELPFVQDALVYEDKNAIGSQILTLEVVLRPGVIKAMNIDAGKEYEFFGGYVDQINKTLVDYERISKYIIRDKDFDRSPAMKILRPKKMY